MLVQGAAGVPLPVGPQHSRAGVAGELPDDAAPVGVGRQVVAGHFGGHRDGFPFSTRGGKLHLSPSSQLEQPSSGRFSVLIAHDVERVLGVGQQGAGVEGGAARVQHSARGQDDASFPTREDVPALGIGLDLESWRPQKRGLCGILDRVLQRAGKVLEQFFIGAGHSPDQAVQIDRYGGQQTPVHV